MTSQVQESTKSYTLNAQAQLKSFFYSQDKKLDYSEKVVNFVKTTMH